MTHPDCTCLEHGPQGTQAMDRRYIGQDPHNGRFADVSLLRCAACGRRWLHYFVEYEGFSESGRWGAVPIDDDAAAKVTASSAAAVLAAAPWHILGGSYFRGAAGRRQGGIAERTWDL